MKKLEDKIRGVPPGKKISGITQLKLLWRDKMTEPQKNVWRTRFMSETTQKELHAQIIKELGIALKDERQVRTFREWDHRERCSALERADLTASAQELAKKFPDWTLDQIRKGVLRLSYERTVEEEDLPRALATVREDVRVEKLSLDIRKVELLEKRETRAEAAKKAKERPKMTREEREQRIKEIYATI